MHTISARQLMWLTVGGLLSRGLFSVPRDAAQIVGTSAWLVIIIDGLLLFLPTLAMFAVNARFPHMIAAEYVEVIFGKWFGKIVSLVILSSFVINVFFTMRVFLEIVSFVVLPLTPLPIMIFLFTVATMYLAGQRLEIIARGAELIIPLMVILFFILIFGGIKNIAWINLQPFFWLDGPLLQAIHDNSHAFFGVQTLWVTIAFLNTRKNAMQRVFTGIGIVIASFLSITVLSIGSFGVERTVDILWPTLNTLRAASTMGNVFGPPGFFLVIIWISVVYISVAFHLFAATITLRQIIGIPTLGRIGPLIAVSVLSMILAIQLFPNRLSVIDVLLRSTTAGWLTLFALPFFIWLVTIIREKLGHFPPNPNSQAS